MATSTVEQKTILPDYQRDFLEKLLTDVRDTATQPVEFPEIQVAGMTPLQQAAIARGAEGIGGFDIARQQIGSKAVQQGAFGGSRQAIAEQELQRNLSDTFARQSAGLRAQAFESAQDRAQKASELFTKAGIATAGLGEAQQGAQMRDVQLLSSLGGQEQQQQQSELDALRATSTQRQFEPYQRLSFMSDIFRGVPSTATTLSSTTTPDPSRFSQIAGIGGGIASLLGAFGGGGGGGLGSILGGLFK